jgi:hypothetical protein
MLSALLSCALAAATFTPQVSQRIDSESATNGPRLLIGELSEPLEGDLTVAARDWALRNRDLVGLPKLATLELDAAFHSRFGASLHYLQKQNGLRVHAAQLVITLDKKARVAIVSSSLENLEAVNSVARTSEREALLIAAGAVPFPAMRGPMPFGGGRQEFFRVGDALHLGWFVHVPTISPADNYYAAIDATDGTLLWARNRVYHAADDAQVYNPSPGGPDGGVGRTPTVGVTLTHSDGGPMVLPNDGGYLNGTQLTAYNCCVNQGCATVLPDGGTLVNPDGGLWPKVVTGTTNFGGANIQYETVECDRMQRASNDPAIHDAGSYVYPPQDPPAIVSGQPGPVVQTDPAHSDEFAEVHAFYQVNRVFDWLRDLSNFSAVKFPNQTPAIGPFKMRDERRVPAQKPAVWANVMFPDFQQVNIQCVFQPPCKLSALGRIDNAAFLARENFAQIPLPDYRLDVDTLMIFQGNRADFGYDATVLWHEFGHGTIYATAALEFGVLALDSRSANDEGGALHEGFADFISGAFGNDAVMGPYVGSRIGGGAQVPGAPVDNYLRNLDNNYSCPQVLWGEVHQDSQHVSAALWKARRDFFQGTDSGRTFDASFYAALVAMAPTVDFTQIAAIITAHVKDAFTPTIADAESKMNSLWAAKGVTGCVKTIDMTNLGNTRPMYGIGQRSGAGITNGVLPGPYQMKFKTPNGAKSVSFSGQAGGGVPGFGGTPDVRILAKSGGPITFTKSGGTLNNDSDKSATAAASGSTLTAKVDIDVPCGATSEVHFTLGTNANSAVSLQNVQVSFEQATTCNPVVDGGTDGGNNDGGSSGGTVFVSAVPDKTASGAAAPSCGCGVGAGVPGLFGLLALALRARRRRR